MSVGCEPEAREKVRRDEELESVCERLRVRAGRRDSGGDSVSSSLTELPLAVAGEADEVASQMLRRAGSALPGDPVQSWMLVQERHARPAGHHLKSASRLLIHSLYHSVPWTRIRAPVWPSCDAQRMGHVLRDERRPGSRDGSTTIRT